MVCWFYLNFKFESNANIASEFFIITLYPNLEYTQSVSAITKILIIIIIIIIFYYYFSEEEEEEEGDVSSTTTTVVFVVVVMNLFMTPSSNYQREHSIKTINRKYNRSVLSPVNVSVTKLLT